MGFVKDHIGLSSFGFPLFKAAGQVENQMGDLSD
jgi:hypothetical protein